MSSPATIFPIPSAVQMIEVGKSFLALWDAMATEGGLDVLVDVSTVHLDPVPHQVGDVQTKFAQPASIHTEMVPGRVGVAPVVLVVLDVWCGIDAVWIVQAPPTAKELEARVRPTLEGG